MDATIIGYTCIQIIRAYSELNKIKLLPSGHFVSICRQFDINKTSTCHFHIIFTSNQDEMPAG